MTVAFVHDLVAVLVGAGIGTSGTTLFWGTKSSMPTGAGPFTLVRATGGTSALETHNALALPANPRPSAQVLVTGVSEVAVSAKIHAAYAAVRQTNAAVNGTFYLQIRPMQEPFDLGLDDTKQRLQMAFNVNAIART